LSNINTIIKTLQELERLHQLNLELLEQLNVISGWLVEHDIPIPNPQILYSLLAKTKSLLTEIEGGEPKFLQYGKLSDGFLQRKKSDKDFTAPYFDRFLFLACCLR
jgi:hypothetical protein